MANLGLCGEKSELLPRRGLTMAKDHEQKMEAVPAEPYYLISTKEIEACDTSKTRVRFKNSAYHPAKKLPTCKNDCMVRSLKWL